jgi:uncharacterized membrane protein
MGEKAMRETPQNGSNLETRRARLGDLERRILDKVLHRQPIARDAVAEFEERFTIGERLADRIASFGGSWPFIAIFLTSMALWMAYNVERPAAFDPYPFILLNLVLSCLAALQAPVIMMSQNRMAAKDRVDARHDYEVNLKAEMEIMALHVKLDELHARQLEAITRLEQLLVDDPRR